MEEQKLGKPEGFIKVNIDEETEWIPIQQDTKSDVRKKPNYNSKEFILRIREKRAQADFSMVIFPSGNRGRKLINKVGLLHKIYRTIQRAVINKEATITDLLVYEQKVNDLIEQTWKDLGTLFPILSNVNISQWKSLVESYEEKRAMVPRFSALIVVPYSDLHGRLLIIVKYLELYKRRWLKQPSADISLCKAVLELSERFEEGVNKLLEEYAPKLGIKVNL